MRILAASLIASAGLLAGCQQLAPPDDADVAGADTTSLSLIQLIAVPRQFADARYVEVDGLCFTAPGDRPALYLSRADYEESNHRSSVPLRDLPAEERGLCSGQWVRATGQVDEVQRGLGVLVNVHIVPRPSGVIP